MGNHSAQDKYSLQVKMPLVGWTDVAGVKVTYATAEVILSECPRRQDHRIYNKTRRTVMM